MKLRKNKLFFNEFITALYVIAALYVAISTLLFVYSTCFQGFFWDEWDTISSYFYRKSDNELFEWVFRYHNEHRLAIPNLLFLANWFVFDANNIFLTTEIVLTQIACMSLVLLSRDNMFSSVRSLVVDLSVLTICFFSSFQLTNMLWGFQFQFYAVYLFSFLSIYFANRSISCSRLTCLAFSGLFAVVGTFTMSNGMLVWVVLAVLLFSKLEKKHFYCFLIFGFLSILLYFLIPSVQERPSSDAIFTIDTVKHFIPFFFTYLGNPLHSLSLWFSFAYGLLSFAAWFCFLVFYKRGGFISRPLIFFSLFILLSAVVTTLGRSSVGVVNATSGRYMTVALFFQALLFVMNMDLIRNPLRGKYIYFCRSWFVLQFLFVVFLLISQGQNFGYHERVYARKLIGFNAIQNDSYDESFLRFLHPDFSNLLEATVTLKSNFPFDQKYNLLFPGKELVEDCNEYDVMLANLSKIHTDTFVAEHCHSCIVFGALKSRVSLFGKRIWLRNHEQEWVGSGYLLYNTLGTNVFNDYKKKPFEQLFYGHMQYDYNLDDLIVYVEIDDKAFRVKNL